jgi:two-component system, NarL family, nitrate/nitrite response regulator NarL
MLGLLFAAAVIADSPVVRRGLSEILDATSELRVVSSASTEDVSSFGVEHVDVIVADVPDLVSVEAALAPAPPGVPVLALVGRREQVRDAVRFGARGAVRRDASGERLSVASLAVAAGLRAFDDESFTSLLAAPVAPSDADVLTPREREVLELVASGRSNRSIGEALGISDHTVKFHVRALLEKLGADTRADAVARALRRGFLTL